MTVSSLPGKAFNRRRLSIAESLQIAEKFQSRKAFNRGKLSIAEGRKDDKHGVNG
jgi:hypothetical protein